MLLDCLNLTANPAGAPSANPYTPSDWQVIFESARLHGLSPLLYYRLHSLGWIDQLPLEVSTKLRKALLIIAHQNVLKFESVLPALEALHKAAIPAIPLKGAHLAAWVYPDPALRPMGDIDLLLRRHDLAPAHALLTELGYRSLRHVDIADECTRMQHLPPMSMEGGFTSLELHWTIASPVAPFAVDIDTLWERARVATFTGIPVRCMAAEDLFLHLVLHTSYQHSYGLGLQPFIDLHTLLQVAGDAYDWDALIQRSRLWGLDRCLFLTLLALLELLVVSPDLGRERICALEPADYQPWMLAAVVDQVTSGRPQLTINLAELLDDERTSEKMTRLFRRVFPEPAVMRREYNLGENGYRLPYYYLKRLTNLTRRNAASAWQLLRRDPQAVEASRRQNQVVQVRQWLEPTT